MSESDVAISDLVLEPDARSRGGRDRSPRYWGLPAFLRVLLITDGTVTQSLEAYFSDPIEVSVLLHSETTSERHHHALDIAPGDAVLKRQVLLRGKRTGTLYAFAESTLVVTRFPADMRRRLMAEQIGIGEMLRDSRLETYRQILGFRSSVAGARARALSISETATVVLREYTIHLSRQPCIEIEEVFPVSAFLR